MNIAGFILTNERSIAEVQEAAHVMRARAIKVVTGHGLDTGWSAASRAIVCGLTDNVIVRTVAGDPSYGGKFEHVQPLPERVLAEVAPWYAVRSWRSTFWIEVGNEPLITVSPNPNMAWVYRFYLIETAKECRRLFPDAKLIAPGHIANHDILFNDKLQGQLEFLRICADAYRMYHAVATHAYSHEQVLRNKYMLEQAGLADKPMWLTECALNEAMPDAVRGQVYADWLRPMPAQGALLYHIARNQGSDPAHFQANYQLNLPTLRAFASRWASNAPKPPVRP